MKTCRTTAALTAGLLLVAGLALPLEASESGNPLIRAAERDGGAPGFGTIRARVSGLRNTQGSIACLLFESPEGWPGDVRKALSKAQATIRGTGQTAGGECMFRDVPFGTYAVATIHDEDENRKMKQNFMGVPQEGYGASNNPKNGFMSGPPYDKSTFSLREAERTLRIRLRY